MSKILSIGDTGPEVENWQRYLASQGFKVTPDGKFGPSTLAATRAMQRKLGVKADGKVGHRTLDRQSQTSSTPLPQARPDMPPAPRPQAPVLGGDMTGASPFVSSGPEADLASMRAGSSNNRAQDQMAQELMGQYYDTRKADAMQANAPPMPFTDQGVQPMTPAMSGAVDRAQGWTPPGSFDAAGPQGGAGATIDVSGMGGGPAAANVPAGNSMDPIKRDAIIRALLQGVGG